MIFENTFFQILTFTIWITIKCRKSKILYNPDLDLRDLEYEDPNEKEEVKLSDEEIQKQVSLNVLSFFAPIKICFTMNISGYSIYIYSIEHRIV